MKRVAYFLLALFVFSALFNVRFAWTEENTVVRVIPEVVDLGSGSVIGEEFAVAVVVEDVDGLFGLEVKFYWDDEYLEYVNHTWTIGFENFSSPIPPSPYAGILHEPIGLANLVYADWYWFAAGCLYGSDIFNGSGTAFVMTFRVKNQLDTPVTTYLTLNTTNLADYAAYAIIHTDVNGVVLIPGLSGGYLGDIDEDGDVDIFDIMMMAKAYGSEDGAPEYDARCDLDKNNKVEIFDLIIAAGNYGKK
ncbi:MAG: hypothetical protein JSV64_01855 [Candidatus Bathyarchaeota archaeon]|nr:MAG: hypothetical protein JSV64_01855 [Candidatus Bathyarchaeota archaeon]